MPATPKLEKEATQQEFITKGRRQRKWKVSEKSLCFISLKLWVQSPVQEEEKSQITATPYYLDKNGKLKLKLPKGRK